MNRLLCDRIKADVRLLVLMAVNPTFHELSRIADFAGEDLLLYPDLRTDLVLWPWCSDDAVWAMEELILAKEISLIHAPIESYVFSDGPIPPLPITDRHRIHGEAHWLPSYIKAKNIKRPDEPTKYQSFDWLSENVGVN